MRCFLGSLTVIMMGLAAASAHAQRDEFAILEAPTGPVSTYTYRLMQDDATLLGTLGFVPITAGPPQQVTVAPDNRQLRALGQYGIVYDLGAFGRASPIASGPAIRFAGAFAPLPDGDLLIANSRGSFVELISFSGGQSSMLTTLATRMPTGQGIDPLDGRVVFRATPYAAPLINRYYFVDPRTGASRSYGAPRFAGPSRINYDAETDTFAELFVDFRNGALRFNRIDRNAGVVFTRILPPSPFWAKAVDMVAASRRGGPIKYWALAEFDLAGVFLLGLRADGAVARGDCVMNRRVLPQFVRLRSESLVVALNAAPNDRSLRLSFPSDAGKPFVVGLSLTGAMRGPRLADGRRIPLTLDGLTMMSLQGGVPGLVGPTTGTLDARGEASVRVNTNSLAGLAGVRIWAAALVLDPNAPSGIAEVSEPKVIILR